VSTHVSKEPDEICEASRPELLAPKACPAVENFLNYDILINSILQCTPVGILLNRESSLSENGCDSVRIAQLLSALQQFNTRVSISISALHSQPNKGLTGFYCRALHFCDLRSTGAQSLLVTAEADTQIPDDLFSSMISSILLQHSKNGVF
jgi:hypothetical protein